MSSRGYSNLINSVYTEYINRAVPDDSVSEQPGFPSLKERQEFLEEINGEIAIHLGTLYFMVEIFRGDDDFAEELSESAFCSTVS